MTLSLLPASGERIIAVIKPAIHEGSVVGVSGKKRVGTACFGAALAVLLHLSVAAPASAQAVYKQEIDLWTLTTTPDAKGEVGVCQLSAAFKGADARTLHLTVSEKRDGQVTLSVKVPEMGAFEPGWNDINVRIGSGPQRGLKAIFPNDAFRDMFHVQIPSDQDLRRELTSAKVITFQDNAGSVSFEIAGGRDLDNEFRNCDRYRVNTRY
ncbi:hypothetical protein [Azospirillum isscasi]|uniref:Invasion associated locus B family protein n=1 Tax=Azospirillum isscasi TaxID=3053926 RepID=A0ABU0WMQ6_9PROT|nr:hypothetical protein [Azospirillum isscasi]MDQ2105490.1 hypothetical protein [Azospirillum isscasi]